MEGISAVGVLYCSHEHVPVDLSQSYQTLVAAVGKEKAERWTYWKEIKLTGDDNGSHKETAVVGGAVDNRANPHQPSGNRHRRQAQR